MHFPPQRASTDVRRRPTLGRQEAPSRPTTGGAADPHGRAPVLAALRSDALSALEQVGYDLEEPVAVGTLGVVLRAVDRRQERPVAIKIIDLDGTRRAGAAIAMQELRQLAALQHPHVVPVVDTGTIDDRLLYLVMPWISGTTLRQRLAQHGRLPVADVVRLGIDLADALVALHGRHLVHRDLKPENILVDGDRATIIDLGLACVSHPALRRTLADAPAAAHHDDADDRLVHGTPAYMSPEQWVTGGALDGRADVYALGCVLYECLVGRAPFERSPLDGRPTATHRWTDSHDPLLALDGGATARLRVPPSARALRRDVPTRFDKLLRRAMAPDRDQRIPSALALREALIQVQASCHRRADGRRRRRILTAAAAALALPAAVAALGIWR
ncbi:MAG: serine/threonine protein kinase [Gemmatimonadetes bacterium]|nr:serine/threonine protein kinase [Gemmatimonadota bacterium]